MFRWTVAKALNAKLRATLDLGVVKDVIAFQIMGLDETLAASL